MSCALLVCGHFVTALNGNGNKELANLDAALYKVLCTPKLDPDATFQRVTHSCIGRLHASKNTYVDCISSGVDNDILFRSRLWQYWRKLLYIHYYSP